MNIDLTQVAAWVGVALASAIGHLIGGRKPSRQLDEVATEVQTSNGTSLGAQVEKMRGDVDELRNDVAIMATHVGALEAAHPADPLAAAHAEIARLRSAIANTEARA